MIERLDLCDPSVADRVLEIQRAAYSVEAALIGFDRIPPLHESLDDLVEAPLEWLGVVERNVIVAAIAITGSGRRCDIDRLVVDPEHHRRGLGRRLVEAVLHHELVTVSTGEGNAPAIALYESLGFIRTGRIEVGPGVWTVQLGTSNHDRLRSSFDADPIAYEAARPGYPEPLFEMLSTRCGLVSGSRVLEIGPGTGQATVSLLDRGAEVVAVEPGGALAARLRQRVQGRPCVVVESDLETAEIEGPFPLAVAATSFHWVRPIEGMVVLAGLVPSGGWFVPFWNVFRDKGPANAEFQSFLDPIERRFQTAERRVAVTHALDLERRRREFEASGAFEVVDAPAIDWQFSHDAASLRALFASFSDWSILPEPDRTRALDEVAAIVDHRDGGTITRTYTTQVYLARRR